MLPRPNRLNLRFHRLRLDQKGKTIHSPLFTLIVAPKKVLPGETDTSFGRFSLLISKKLTKKAVSRNILKRRLSHILHLHLGYLPQDKDIIIIPKKYSLQADINQLQQNLLQLLKSLQ